MRFRRLRWAIFGGVVGAVLTVAAFVVGFIITPDPSDVDVADAAGVAKAWAAEHRRPHEIYRVPQCESETSAATADRFACWVHYEPQNRTFTLLMRTVAPGGEYKVVLAEVRRGRHPIPDF
jgi:hypothetical protein